MKTVNKVQLLGNLGRDPEVRYSQSGTAIATFSLATTTRKKVSGEYQDFTMWHNCVTFGKLAEIVSQYLVKGSKIYAEGSIEYQEYESEGQTKKVSKIIINELSMLSSAQAHDNSAIEKPTASNYQENVHVDDIPF